MTSRQETGEKCGLAFATTLTALVFALAPLALLCGCGSVPKNALFVYHDPSPRGTVIKKGLRPAQTFIIKTASRGEEDVGALEVHTGSVGYWIDDGDEWEQLLKNPVRKKRLRSLSFSKSTPIFTIPPEHFRVLIDRVEAAGLRKLPAHPNSRPPVDQAYYMMQIDQQHAEFFVKPTLASLSLRVHAQELTRDEAQDIADCWARVKTEIYNFGQYSLGSTGQGR